MGIDATAGLTSAWSSMRAEPRIEAAAAIRAATPAGEQPTDSRADPSSPPAAAASSEAPRGGPPPGPGEGRLVDIRV